MRAIGRYRGQIWGEDTAEFSWASSHGEAQLNPAVLLLHVFDEHFRAVSGLDVDLRF